MMLLWILWTRITVPDSRISSVSAATGTVKPSHPTPRARADLQCTSAARDKQQQLSGGKERATPNIRQISIGEQTSWDFIVRSNFSAQREKTMPSEAWGALWYGAAKVSCSGWGRLNERLFIRHLISRTTLRRRTSLRQFLRTSADLIRSTYRKDFCLPQQVFPLLNYYIVLLFFLTFKEPSMKSRPGCRQLHINGYEIRNTSIITKISLHLNRVRLLIRRFYCFPTHSLHV